MQNVDEVANQNSTSCVTFFGSDVEEVLSELCLNTDSMDMPEFDVVAYINQLFPTEQSLVSIDECMMDLEVKICDLDKETSDIIRGRLQSEEQGHEVIQDAVQLIKNLFTRIHDVQARATRSEEMVHDITKEIQLLDQAKRNLTVSITTLSNLVLIVNALDRLNDLLTTSNSPCRSNDYSDSTNPFNEYTVGGKHRILSLPLVTELTSLLTQVHHLIRPMEMAYACVPSVGKLVHELNDIHNQLAKLIPSELKSLLGAARSLSSDSCLIQAICRMVDLLPDGPSVKSTVLNGYILEQLAEYQELFEPAQTTAWIDKIDHRYAWFRSNLPLLERKIQALFPSEWHVTEELIVVFCRHTREHLMTVMSRRRAELTHSLIVFGLQRTLAFEGNLNKLYPTYVILERTRQDLMKTESRKISTNPFDEPSPTRDVEAPVSEKEPSVDGSRGGSTFSTLISSCFDEHFHLYLDHVEKVLRDQLHSRWIGDFTVNKSSLSGHNQLAIHESSDASNYSSAENTLYSATDMFLMYKQIIKQTLQLSRRFGLLGLVGLLRKFLTNYTTSVLLAQIPGMPSLGSSQFGLGFGLFSTDPTSKATSMGLSGLSALGLSRSSTHAGSSVDFKSHDKNTTNIDRGNHSIHQLVSSFIQGDCQFPLVRLTEDEIHRVCVLLVTSIFCIKTVEELEKRLLSEVDPAMAKSELSFAAVLDGFASCRTLCVHRLVANFETATEPQLAAMARLPWATLAQVGDQSVYVTEIIKVLRSNIVLIRDTLYNVRATLTQLCIKFARTLVTRFISSLYRCKPVNTFGAEQLLLDTQSLKAAILNLPSYGSKVSQTPRSFVNLVHEGMGRAERIIKAVMLPVGSPELLPANPAPSTGFVAGPIDSDAANVFLASFKQLLPDASSTDLQKVLDMKGVKSADQQLILQQFTDTSVENRLKDLSQSNNSNNEPSDPASVEVNAINFS